MPDVVLVVDMLRGFLEEGHNLYCGDDARNIIPNVQTLLEREAARGSNVFYICDTHKPDDLEFQMFPVHCVEGTVESEVIPELRAYPGERISKQRYSGFYGTDLEQRLKELAPERIIVCGVCTDICVLHTTADARNRDYVVEVPTDAVATFDADAHRWALQHMERILGARLVSAQPAGGS
ncbi:MAG: cysteine hydrolase [Chloroflexi bacterium]|nr:cysteine hydrolase [Chloroflexota bacterium]